MQIGLHDPRFVGLLLLAGIAVTSLLAPAFFMEVALTVAASAVLAPGIKRLSLRTGVSHGLIVATFAFVLIALLGLLGWYGVPTLVRGINETMVGAPEGLKRLTPFAQEWLGGLKSRLEAVFPGQGSLEDMVKKKLPDLAGPGGQAAKVLLSTIFGSLIAMGHFLLFLVLTAILSAEWDKNAEKARYLVDLYAPRQAPALLSFGSKFQAHGGELFIGIGIVMLIFMPIFFAMLYFYAGFSLGKSLLYGMVLGITSAIPTVGGIITYLLVIVVGIVNLGMDQDALWTIAMMYLFSFVVHFFETKFVTPRVLGHRIAFTSFAVITVLVGSVLLFGIAKGILTGLFLLVALKAITEVSDEMRSAAPALAAGERGRGHGHDGRDGAVPLPAAGLAPAAAVAGQAALAAGTIAGSMSPPPKLAHKPGRSHRRR